MPKRGIPSGKCTVCAHAERGRIDFLAASGSPLNPLAEQFGLSKDSLHRHFKAHVTETYKRQVKIGPLQSEDSLRKLAAEEGVSAIEHLRGVRAILNRRLMVAYEAGDDTTISALSGRFIRLSELLMTVAGTIPEPMSGKDLTGTITQSFDTRDLVTGIKGFRKTWPGPLTHEVVDSITGVSDDIRGQLHAYVETMKGDDHAQH